MCVVFVSFFSLMLSIRFYICIDRVHFALFNCSQIELATGRHPYSEFKTVFLQMQEVIEGESPQLPAGQFSKDFHDFINCW